jgi:hypothetical protein
MAHCIYNPKSTQSNFKILSHHLVIYFIFVSQSIGIALFAALWP